MSENILENVKLSEEENALVEEKKNGIDLTDSTSIISYGADAQKKIVEFSDAALKGVKTKDLGDVSNVITSLVTQLKGFDVEEKKGFFSFLKKKSNIIIELKAKYDSVEKNINGVIENLEHHQDILTKDVVMLDEMYDANLDYFKQLSMYIIAGKKKLEEAQLFLEELNQKAKESNLTEDAQKANDFSNLCERFEKRIADLEVTRNVSIQMAPQIRLIQNSNSLMIEKIQTTLNNTIPLWKNQMTLALGLEHSRLATEAQHAVNEATNELLKKNAEKLHQGTVLVANESERSIVDVETLVHTNKELIDTLDEVLKIQEEGHQRRVEAEGTLSEIESELKNKLLGVKQNL